ncbi:MAG TPA: tetratricopeptide repeat protein [Gemmatimonadales bacterium]|jgi:tol-pal system protein YbgF
MLARHCPAFVLGLLALGACASKGDLRRVEEQLTLSRAENMRADSARAVQLAQILETQRRTMDSLGGLARTAEQTSRQLGTAKGDLANDLYNIQQQLVQIQALTGQSQQRLTELRTQLEARGEQLNAPPADTSRPAPPSGGAQPSADQMYEASLNQLRRGSPGTARSGFREFLRLYPTDPRVPDATYFIGESFAAESPDSAVGYYQKVVETAPQSIRAASAVYKLGLVAERKKDLEGAKAYYQRVISDYPRSDEAALARDRLKSLGR